MLTEEELVTVLQHYPSIAGAAGGLLAPVIMWRSPRPWSAAALVKVDGLAVLVKRHDHRVRSAVQLAGEHAFAQHLRNGGLSVPRCLTTRNGATTVSNGAGSVYEVHELAPGTDLYRDAPSWSGYKSLGHARSAGSALAKLHIAAKGFRGLRRGPGPLVSSTEVISSPAPMEALHELVRSRPALGAALARWPWECDTHRDIAPAAAAAARRLSRLSPQWAHGDWHPSNLTWTSTSPDAQVAAIFDFGLSNKTFALHDLAVALERSTVSWLDLARAGRAEPDLEMASALLEGYSEVSPLRPADFATIAAVLPVSHVELALSEIEYYSNVMEKPADAEVAYSTYLLGHARWFSSPEGSRMTGYLLRFGGKERA